jgi:hypothetical protein
VVVDARLTPQWACDQANLAAAEASVRAYQLARQRQAVREGREELRGSTVEEVRQAERRSALARVRAELGHRRAELCHQRAAMVRAAASRRRDAAWLAVADPTRRPEDDHSAAAGGASG